VPTLQAALLAPETASNHFKEEDPTIAMSNFTTQLGCRFCRDNNLLADAPVFETRYFFGLRSVDPMLPHAFMVVSHRHSLSPFELCAEEWSDLGNALDRVKMCLADQRPDGFTLGWNVGAVAGQHILHTHLHVIPRYKGEANEGAGIRRIMRTPLWDIPQGP
jgi:diadenosine tetraphosphate (Ap4A) HIT family hydrolase